ncbi:MAG TPA: ABC transporter ATP-binding protein [Candidatus Limnocylindria bacterium]|jgi:ATP-binding cassette subfamily B protein/subfamily B ATP-binding cassette protein MsbA|nr:ABC transporter ATP-binding protein [Candidatus Limnocylindria bacterium]
MQQLWRALSFFRADWPRVLAGLALLALTTLAGLLKPWPMALIVDSVLGHQPLPGPVAQRIGDLPGPTQLAVLVGAMLVLHFGSALLGAAQNAVVIVTGLRGLARVRRAVFDWLLRLSLRRLQGSQAGDLIYRATWDTYAFQTLFTQGVFTFLGALASVLAMTVVMWRLNGLLTLVALATVPVLLLVMQAFGGRMGRRAGEAQSADAGIATTVQQLVTNLQLIQSFTREPKEAEHFERQAQTSFTARWGQHRAEVLYLTTVSAVFALGTAAILWVGARQVLAGTLSVGELLVFLAYLTQLYEPLNQLSHVGSTVTNARAGTHRVLELLGENAAVKGGQRTVVRGADNGLEFDRVGFAYTPERPVLHEVSFRVGPGEAVALIGPSGAGKTTLLQFIPRFLDPDSGTVRLGGADLRDFSVHSLRENVALVLQEPLLLPASIAENIGYGKPDATRAQIEAAARSANAHIYIEKLPQGYDTIVGDGAARLSVGEKQRLNLARAFLKDAPILLLDEPTSALDAESEALVLTSLRELMRGRTTVMVAHRLGTLRTVNRIIALHDGRVAESGTAEELLASGGYYAKVSGRH